MKQGYFNYVIQSYPRPPYSFTGSAPPLDPAERKMKQTLQIKLFLHNCVCIRIPAESLAFKFVYTFLTINPSH
jgi:hypothetical protein